MDKTKDGFNKLQWSKFVGKEEQYVVRCNDMGEFIQLIAQVNDFVAKQPKEEAPPFVEQPVQTTQKKKFCPVHGTPMEEHVSKKTGKPYHSHKDEVGAMCFGKGSLPPLDNKYGNA